MRIEHIIKEYTAFLLKTAYLITRDRTKVEEIVEKTFSKFIMENLNLVNTTKIKAKLLEHLLKNLQEYYKSWYYQKLKLKLILETNEQFNHSAFKEDLSYSILKLPIRLREVATLYFYCELTTAEISRIIGVSQGTVQQRILKSQNIINKPVFEEELGTVSVLIDQYLKEWNDFAELIQQKIEDKVEIIVQLPPKKSYKKIYISIFVILSAIIALVVSQQFMKKDTQTVEEERLGGINPAEAMTTDQFFPGAKREKNILIPPDISFEIAKYYSYYLESAFYTEAESELNSREKVYYYYVTQYALEKMNYAFDMEKIKSYQERAVLTNRINKENPDYVTFLQLLFDKYLITEEDVIKYYLVPQEISKFFEGEFYTKYGETNTNIHDLVGEYYKIINFDIKEETALVQSVVLNQNKSLEKFTDHSKLPFKIEEGNFEFAYNEAGEIIVLNPTPNFIPLVSDRNYFYFYNLQNEFNRTINRLSIGDYITFLEQKYEEYNDSELYSYIEMYKILNRSIK